MKSGKEFSRRKFLTSASGVAATTLFAARGRGALTSFLNDPKPASLSDERWKSEAVIDLTKSPHAKLKPIPVSAVVIQEGFWSKRRVANVSSSIPSMHQLSIRKIYCRESSRSNIPARLPMPRLPVLCTARLRTGVLCTIHL